MPRPFMIPQSRWLAALALLLLAACASTPREAAMSTYDFGALPAAAPVAAASRPTLLVLDVAAPNWMDSNLIFYRLAYDNLQQPHPYANSRWAMAPALLLTQRLKAQLAMKANVLSAGDTVHDTMLKVELDEFAQRFDTPQTSAARLQLRASLIRNGKLVAQRTFAVEQAASSPDARGGVQALTVASDAALTEMTDWVLAQLR